MGNKLPPKNIRQNFDFWNKELLRLEKQAEARNKRLGRGDD